MSVFASIEIIATIGALALVGGGFALGQVFSDLRRRTSDRTRARSLGRGRRWSRPIGVYSRGSSSNEAALGEFESSEEQRVMWRSRQEVKRLEKALVAAQAERDEYREQAVQARAALEALGGTRGDRRAA